MHYMRNIARSVLLYYYYMSHGAFKRLIFFHSLVQFFGNHALLFWA